jgi:predicted RNA-binding protein with EMAP domain
MWKLLPASSFKDITSKGIFCDKEVMRNTSGTAPVFPNVELKSADSMFLALILYLS